MAKWSTAECHAYASRYYYHFIYPNIYTEMHIAQSGMGLVLEFWYAFNYKYVDLRARRNNRRNNDNILYTLKDKIMKKEKKKTQFC